MSEPESYGTIVHVKPEWAQWMPDVFQQTLPGLPYVMPEGFLPTKDCANCLFSGEDWRGDGFCYMFRIEPTGDKCGQFKRVEPISKDSNDDMESNINGT